MPLSNLIRDTTLDKSVSSSGVLQCFPCLVGGFRNKIRSAPICSCSPLSTGVTGYCANATFAKPAIHEPLMERGREASKKPKLG